MDKETLDLELKELDKIIRKAQKQSLPFRRIVIEVRKKQAALKREFRQKRIAENKARKEAERKAKKQCMSLGSWLGRQCGLNATVGDYCKKHSPLTIFCASKPCKTPAPIDSKYCKKHDPDYEFVLIDKNKNWHEWRKKASELWEN